MHSGDWKIGLKNLEKFFEYYRIFWPPRTKKAPTRWLPALAVTALAIAALAVAAQAVIALAVAALAAIVAAWNWLELLALRIDWACVVGADRIG